MAAALNQTMAAANQTTFKEGQSTRAIIVVGVLSPESRRGMVGTGFERDEGMTSGRIYRWVLRALRVSFQMAAASGFLAVIAVAPGSGNSWLSQPEDSPMQAQNTPAASYSVGPFPKPAQEPAPAPTDAGNTETVSTEAGVPDTLVRSFAGIPSTLLKAYVQAEQEQAASQNSCNIKWWLLAAIGRIESNHARGGQVDASGTTLAPILGPQLSGGNGFAAISDTDGGAWDGDTAWDRAVGAMQFIPSTWRSWGVDGNGDGQASPHNVFDAALAAGKYLCAGGRDLSDANQLVAAIYSYNHSHEYVQSVLSWARVYASGASEIPDAEAQVSLLSQGEQAPSNQTAGAPPDQGGQPSTVQPGMPGGPPASQPATGTGNSGGATSGSPTAPPDKTPPVVTYTAPWDPIRNPSPAISGTAKDNIGVVSVSLSLNGGAATACSIDGAGKVSCATSDLIDGTYFAEIKAVDAAGNIGAASGSFTVDTKKPEATYIGPKDAISDSMPTVTGAATDKVGVVSVSLSLNGGADTPCSIDGQGKVSCPTSGLADGAYIAEIEAVDAAGNTGKASGSFTVDTLPPVVTYTGPTGVITDHNPTVTGEAIDNAGVVSVSLILNGGPPIPCTIDGEGKVSCAAADLADGTYTAELKAADAAGNVGTSEGSFSVTSS